MGDRLYLHDDFEATIRICTADEGGRRTPAFNGIRCDFSYAEDQSPGAMYMIWPDFFAAEDGSLLADAPLPVGVSLRARMLVAVDEMRAEVHRTRITPGVRFYCHEGARRVGEGVVTRVTGLFASRDAPSSA